MGTGPGDVTCGPSRSCTWSAVLNAVPGSSTITGLQLFKMAIFITSGEEIPKALLFWALIGFPGSLILSILQDDYYALGGAGFPRAAFGWSVALIKLTSPVACGSDLVE